MIKNNLQSNQPRQIRLHCIFCNKIEKFEFTKGVLENTERLFCTKCFFATNSAFAPKVLGEYKRLIDKVLAAPFEKGVKVFAKPTEFELRMYKVAKQFIKNAGYTPTILDLANFVKVNKDTVHKSIRALETKGYLRREGPRRKTWVFLREAKTNLKEKINDGF